MFVPQETGRGPALRTILHSLPQVEVSFLVCAFHCLFCRVRPTRKSFCALVCAAWRNSKRSRPPSLFPLVCKPVDPSLRVLLEPLSRRFPIASKKLLRIGSSAIRGSLSKVSKDIFAPLVPEL